jgi:hypothetical protein
MNSGWHHLAVTFSRTSGTTTIYYDGEHRSTFSFTGTVYNSTYPLNIGGVSGGNVLNGLIEEVRLSDVIRYTGATYPVPGTPFTPDSQTRGLWHFDETAGSTIFSDSSSYQNTAYGLNGAQTYNP